MQDSLAKEEASGNRGASAGPDSTLAELLGISLPDATGRSLLGR